MNIVDHPCVPGFINSLDGGDCIKWRTPRDDLAAADLPEEASNVISQFGTQSQCNRYLHVTFRVNSNLVLK